MEEEPWEPTVLDWARPRQHFTTAELLRGAFGMEEARITKRESNTVGTILRSHGFKQTSYRSDRVWQNPNPPEQPQANVFPPWAA
jgi:hypothetical protein